jgi:hypothetical protein
MQTPFHQCAAMAATMAAFLGSLRQAGWTTEQNAIRQGTTQGDAWHPARSLHHAPQPPRQQVTWPTCPFNAQSHPLPQSLPNAGALHVPRSTQQSHNPSYRKHPHTASGAGHPQGPATAPTWPGFHSLFSTAGVRRYHPAAASPNGGSSYDATLNQTVPSAAAAAAAALRVDAPCHPPRWPTRKRCRLPDAADPVLRLRRAIQIRMPPIIAQQTKLCSRYGGPIHPDHLRATLPGYPAPARRHPCTPPHPYS